MSSKRASRLVVILTLVVGVGLLAVGLCHLRAAANNRETKDRLKNLVMALHACQETRICLPPAYDAFGQITYPASMHVHLLPFLGQDALYRDFTEPGKGRVDASLA